MQANMLTSTDLLYVMVNVNKNKTNVKELNYNNKSWVGHWILCYSHVHTYVSVYIIKKDVSINLVLNDGI